MYYRSGMYLNGRVMIRGRGIETELERRLKSGGDRGCWRKLLDHLSDKKREERLVGEGIKVPYSLDIDEGVNGSRLGRK